MQTRPGLGSLPVRNIAITLRGIVQIKVVHLLKSFDTINVLVELFWWWVQNGGKFHSFHEEEIGALLTDDICYLENICKIKEVFIS